MSSAVKIRIKIGSVKLSYEGEPSFLEDGLEGVLTKLNQISEITPDGILEKNNASSLSINKNYDKKISTEAIVNHAGVKNGPGLAICAMAQIEIIQGNDSSSSSEISRQMESVKNYYKKSMKNNISATLKRLSKKKNNK